MLAIPGQRKGEKMLRIFPFDKTGVSEAVAQFEEDHDILLPEEYRTFLLNYNGGNALKTSFKIKKESSDIRAFYGSDNILQACKIIRKHSTLPIGEIKTKIEKNEILLESDYLDLDQLIVMQEILASLIDLGAEINLYKGQAEVDMGFLNNTIETYINIAADREKLDELMFDREG